MGPCGGGWNGVSERFIAAGSTCHRGLGGFGVVKVRKNVVNKPLC